MIHPKLLPNTIRNFLFQIFYRFTVHIFTQQFKSKGNAVLFFFIVNLVFTNISDFLFDPLFSTFD